MVRIRALVEDARPAGSVKLVGEDATHRLRVGDWRVIYVIVDDEVPGRVLVSRVKRRNERTYR